MSASANRRDAAPDRAAAIRGAAAPPVDAPSDARAGRSAAPNRLPADARALQNALAHRWRSAREDRKWTKRRSLVFAVVATSSLWLAVIGGVVALFRLV